MTSRHLLFHILLLLAFCATESKAQNPDSILQKVFLKDFQNCKLPAYYSIPFPLDTSRKKLLITVAPIREKVLEVSGEAGFNHFKRTGNSDHLLFISSSTDIVSVNLKLVYRESYPFRIFARYNKTLPFQIDDQFEFSFGADQRSYREILRDRIVGKLKSQGLERQALLSKRYEQVFADYKSRSSALKDPKYVQSMIEARSSAPDVKYPVVFSQRPSIGPQFVLCDSSGAASINVEEIAKKHFHDSILENHRNSLALEHNKRAQAKDSLTELLSGLSDSIQSEKKKLSEELYALENELSDKVTYSQLNELAEKHGVKDSTRRKKWTDILLRTNVQLGKFLINQSDLTVNNLFLTGVSVRYGDEKFVQLSAGYYDYGFREVFRFRSNADKNRSRLLALKVGKTDGKKLSALNVFLGKKIDHGSSIGELRTVAGFGFERRIQFTRNFSVNLEMAKSTARNSDETKGHRLKDLMTEFSGETIALSGSVSVFLPKSSTEFDVTYRYYGSKFESFNATQYYNPQNNFSSRINQPLFKRRVFLAAGVKYSDFRTNAITNNLMTKTLFGSANVSVRLKRMPVITVGYFPGSQIYWLNKEQLYEYYYYILCATLSHHLKIGNMPVQAVMSYNEFNNKYKDSVVVGAQSSYNVFLTAWKGRFSYSLGYSYQQLPVNDLKVVEGGLNYSQNNFRIGSSLKYNHQSGRSRMGYSLVGGVKLGFVGTVSLLFEKAFLAGRSGEAFPVTTGSIQIIKPLNFSIWK